MSFGLLRREKGGPGKEPRVGAWGAGLGRGMGSWLPLTGVHQAPWTQDAESPAPVIDHAVFGAPGDSSTGRSARPCVSVEERRSREMMRRGSWTSGSGSSSIPKPLSET